MGFSYEDPSAGAPQAILDLAWPNGLQEQQATIGGNRTPIEARGQFLAANGWKIKGKKAIVAHGGCCFSDAPEGYRLDNEFLHQITELRYIRQPKIIARVNNSG